MAIHLLFILYVVFGSLLVSRWPRTAWLHIPAAVWGSLIELFVWQCPLTPLEQLLRRWAGQEGYEGGFIDHYITSVLYPAGLTRTHQIALGVAVFAINAVIYAWIWRRFRSQSGQS